MFNKKKPRQQRVGHVVGALAGMGVVVFFLIPGNASYYSRGPLTAGHEKLKCEWCHKATTGSLRQKLQANVQYALNNRSTLVPLGYRAVVNDDCLACHERSDDRHPVFRFFEPRYAKARQLIKPQYCVSCHVEHSGKRVSIAPTFCSVCHKELTLKKDPISVSHETLVRTKQWRTCLGCHDFHGNHRMKTPTDIRDAFADQKIMDYLTDGPAVYPGDKIVNARKRPPSDT